MATQARKSATKKTTGKAAKKTVAKKAVARKTVAKAAKKATTKQPARKVTKVAKPSTRKAATKTTTSSKSVAKKAVTSRPVAKQAAAKATLKRTAPAKRTAKAPAKSTSTKASSGMAKKTPRSAPKPRGITRQQALANTRALLEAKQAHDREPPPWQSLETPGGHVSAPGFQSDEARIKADELHAGESRMQAIQGSIGSQDRHQQGKRDAR